MNLLRVSSLKKRSLLGWSPDQQQSLALHTVTCFFRFQSRGFAVFLFLWLCSSFSDALWVVRINRPDLRVEDVSQNAVLCSTLFVGARKSVEQPDPVKWSHRTFTVYLSVRITLVIISASTTESTWLAVVCQVTHLNYGLLLLTSGVVFVSLYSSCCLWLFFVPFTRSAILDLVYRYYCQV